MSAKLTVHKFETGLNYKSLQITIEDDLSETKFSEWLDGRNFQKKKDSEKPSRLVVKIVSGNEINQFNLDCCAKLINNPDINLCQSTSTCNYRKISIKSDECNLQPSKTHEKGIANSYHDHHGNEESIEKFKTSNNQTTLSNSHYMLSLNTVSPLEYSLEKVKENNARIMENIHMLNRTLNYTKKKEIMDIVFPKSMRSFPCETCGKCFVYETGLKRHYTMRHSIIESRPGWQVVWTCIQCFQVWPLYDIALQHTKQCCLSESTDCVREIKTSSLLQCEFCEKVFTSIPRMLRHAKTHTTESNYECNICSGTFTSYKTAEEHWLNCQWLCTNYNFSLPKLLLCNACDRKFRNYEQLYSHRYKTGHFIAKINSNHLGAYLYQCEVCGDSFSSTSQLQTHKRQSHPYHNSIPYNIVQNWKEYENNQYTCTENKTDNNIN